MLVRRQRIVPPSLTTLPANPRSPSWAGVSLAGSMPESHTTLGRLPMIRMLLLLEAVLVAIVFADHVRVDPNRPRATAAASSGTSVNEVSEPRVHDMLARMQRRAPDAGAVTGIAQDGQD